MSYNRKYYLHQCVRKEGFSLTLEKTNKTINVNPGQTETIRDNKYVTELSNKYNYGVQFTSPMTNQ